MTTERVWEFWMLSYSGGAAMDGTVGNKFQIWSDEVPAAALLGLTASDI